MIDVPTEFKFSMSTRYEDRNAKQKGDNEVVWGMLGSLSAIR